MSADLDVRLKIGASKNGELPRYFVENMYLRTDFVLDGTIQWLPESTVLLDECPEREGWTKLSKYLMSTDQPKKHCDTRQSRQSVL